MSDAPATHQMDVPLVQVENVTVRRNRQDVIKDINLKIHPGEFVGVVGPNGAGKSTLVQAILGLLKYQSGNILVAGKPPMSKEVFGKIGWVSQAASHLPKNVRLTVREMVSLGLFNNTNWFGLGRSNTARIGEALRMVGIEHLESRDVNQLSGGERQRAVIARALVSGADFLVLDEPLVGMDRASRTSLLKLLDDFCHDQNKR